MLCPEQGLPTYLSMDGNLMSERFLVPRACKFKCICYGWLRQPSCGQMLYKHIVNPSTERLWNKWLHSRM